MKPEFWHRRWREGRIAFHQPRANPHLVEHWPLIGAEPDSAVLVPLAGKSLDLLWLAEAGHEVIGVELSPIAVRDFFSENDLEPQPADCGPLSGWRAGPVHLLEGDFHHVERERLPAITAVYDRAALVALPPEMRPAYVEKLAGLLEANGEVLLISLEFPPGEREGPPFPIGPDEIHDLFDPLFVVEQLASTPAAGPSDQTREVVYRMRRRP